MTVNATLATDPLTITPNRVRYSFHREELPGISRGTLSVQRSDKRANSTWVDDPRPGSSKQVPLPEGEAIDAVVGLLPTLMTRLGVTPPFRAYRVWVNSQLDADGRHSIAVIAQLKTNTGWVCKMIEDLEAFIALPPNTDLAASVVAAWDSLDAAINAANATEKWV